MVLILEMFSLYHIFTPGFMIDIKYILVILPVLFVMMFSCQSTITDRYTEDELVQIMLDAHTLGLIYNRQEERNDTLKLEYYGVLEERYGVDRKEFQELVNGLILNSKLYDKVYDRMTKKVERAEHLEMQGL